MKLQQLRISGFQSFGPERTEIDLPTLTFLIGPNGSGKTAVLQALCRMFAFDPSLRRIQRSDFHVPFNETAETAPDERTFWIEAEFIFPELAEDGGVHSTIPPNFAHMRLDIAEGVARVRIRLDAKLDADGEIYDDLNYVLDLDAEGQPKTKHQVPRQDRNSIHVHYLPARRDPSDHISYTANSLLGRVLRSVNWQAERDSIKELTGRISDGLAANGGVASLSGQLTEKWQELHKGSFFADPQITFVKSEIESLLRHLSVSFSPGHDDQFVDFSRLSDGQKSLLYLSLVLAIQGIGRDVLCGDEDSFDVDKLKPAIFTMIAMEEPENSLSPYYLGRVVQSLSELCEYGDAQSLIATHAPSMLRRVDPERIRYMRLNTSRQTQVAAIVMPPNTDESYKFVREAVQAFPEIYFSRLVVLGEGDSEEIVLPRLFKVKGLATDEAAISVAPLGGRHVNHFWRLLSTLEIPFVTLLDLDLARHQGGWGRIRYVVDQLLKFPPEGCTLTREHLEALPKWNDDKDVIDEEGNGEWIDYLESLGVFFSSPMDLDFAMLMEFPEAYNVDNGDLVAPDESKIKAVLGNSHHGVAKYTKNKQNLFLTYHKRFKLGSKPATHLNALANLSDKELVANMPKSLSRLIDAIIAQIAGVPE
ncbi:MAG TPA: AAA family ATPase [Geobacteraceae bacterium]